MAVYNTTINQEIENLIPQNTMKSEKTKIKQCHPGLELSEITEQLDGSPCPILLNNNEDPKRDDSQKRLGQLKNIIIKFNPTNFEEFLWLFKTTALLFITSKSPDDSNLSLNVLRRTFKMSGKNWDANPIHLHVLSKEIFDSLKYDKNRLYFARKISNISRMSLNISICIVWAVFFKTLKIEVNMYRFHKFSEIIEHINKIDVKTYENDENDLYILLQAISFILNTITGPKILEHINNRYSMYYEYKNEDFLELKNWCLKLNRKFSIQKVAASDGEFNKNHAMISDIIELDILHFLEHIYPTNLNETEEFCI